MELRDLRYFAVVAEHGNLRRAAESLGLSQPGLSKSLRRLEEAMQAKLVSRTRTGVELTAVGAALHGHVQRLCLSVADVEREGADLSQGRAGELHVGAGAGVHSEFLAAACSALLMHAPKASLALTQVANSDLLQGLDNGDYDLVVSGIPHPAYKGILQEPLYEDPFIVYAARNHQLTRRRMVSLSDLSDERWALSTPDDLTWTHVHRVFEGNNLPPPRVAFQTKSPLVRMQAVACSDLVSFSSRLVLNEGWRRFPLAKLRAKDLSWRRTVGVSYRKDAYLSPICRHMIQILKSTARKIPGA